MVGTHAPEMQAGRDWLLFVHQLPAEPAYLRVKVLRRLKAVGAVALKSTIYVLPDGDGPREDFEWLRREILAEGGDAVLTTARCVAGISDRQIEEALTAEREEEYRALEAEAETLAERGGGRRGDVARLRRRLEQIQARDHFGGAAQHAAIRAIAALEENVDGVTERRDAAIRPQGAVWVTRTGVKVDRMSSAWLIRRFIDPAAEFRFVSPEYVHTPGELRFDMFEGEYTHEGTDCTFETLVRAFGIDAPGIRRIGEIVHDLDCREDRYGHAEGAGVASLVAGIAAVHARDEDRIAAAATVFDSLLAAFASA